MNVRNPSERLNLSHTELTELLDTYRQSFNLGVEDLARLIGAAELQVATRSTVPLTAKDIMSRDLITVHPDSGLGEVADLFKKHKFTSLPVVGPDRKFVGIIFQMNLIVQGRENALRLDRGYLSALRRLLDRERDSASRAGDIMSVAGPRATTHTPLVVLLSMMADDSVDAVPILESGQIVGIVTRTDLIAAMVYALRAFSNAIPKAEL